MMLVGDGNELILMHRPKRCRAYRLVCVGRKRHYRRDGSCKHTEAVIANLKPGVKVKVIPWGGEIAEPEETR